MDRVVGWFRAESDRILQCWTSNPIIVLLSSLESSSRQFSSKVSYIPFVSPVYTSLLLYFLRNCARIRSHTPFLFGDMHLFILVKTQNQYPPLAHICIRISSSSSCYIRSMFGMYRIWFTVFLSHSLRLNSTRQTGFCNLPISQLLLPKKKTKPYYFGHHSATLLASVEQSQSLFCQDIEQVFYGGRGSTTESIRTGLP